MPIYKQIANLHSELPIFRVKSVKIYTWQKKFTRASPVAPVTNMRYDYVNHFGGDVDVDANSHFMEMSLDQAGMEYGTIMIL